MSYLDPTRIHFAGQFRADVSTVNNFAPHYDNSQFVRPDDQLPGNSGGWWQPAGTGAWRLDRCTITSAVLNGAAADDPVVGMEMRDTGDRVSAKLVDLDPEQQMVSMIYGLELRLVDPVSRKILMRGQFQSTPFYDIWFQRGLQTGGDSAASAFYQSVLTEVEWGDLSGSLVLQALRSASDRGILSIKFNTDSYSMKTPDRGYGRLVGTIGPWSEGEPRHFTAGRFLAPAQPQLSAAPINYVGCWVDSQNRRVIADFGNALHTSYGGLADVGPLHLIVPYTDPNSGNVLSLDLGILDGYPGHGWYERTAGIQAFPANRALSAAELAIVAQNPLCVATPSAVPPSFTTLAVEAADGLFLRPDLFVYRIEPGTTQDVPVMALQFGQPVGGAPISTQVTVSGSQPQPNPPSALTVANAGSIQTDPTGWATISLAAADPGTPRVPDGKTGDGIDGQVYSVNVGINGAANAGTAFYPGSCFVSVLVFSRFDVPAAPGWSDVQPILQQYSNLYPRPHGPDRYVPYRGQPPLHPVVNLGDEAQVRPFAPMIARALQLPIDHPNHMPVTRDLSAGKRQALLAYVESVMAGAPELLAGPAEPAAAAGAAATKPAQAPARDFAAARAAAAPMAGGFEPEEPLGGKTVARMRAAARHAAALSTPEEK